MLVGGGFLVEVEAEQDRQAERASCAKRQLDDHPQDNPAVAPVGDGCASARHQWIVVHAGPEHLRAAFAGQGIVRCPA